MLHYNVASRTASIGKHKGKKMFFAQPAPTTKLTARAVEDLITEKTSLTRGDVRHAITSLAEILRWALAEGISVDLADLGSFKVDARGKMMPTEAEVNASTIKTPTIRFYPRKEMRKYAKSVSISVRNANGTVTTNAPSPSGTPAVATPGVSGGTGHSI